MRFLAVRGSSCLQLRAAVTNFVLRANLHCVYCIDGIFSRVLHKMENVFSWVFQDVYTTKHFELNCMNVLFKQNI